jgi:hypothetical protein
MDNLRHQQNTELPRTAQTQIRCIQINLQHSKSATNNPLKITDTDETDIILIQEPYEYQNRLARIGKKYRVFTAGTGKHRTAIIIRNDNIDAILITKISDEDTVVLEIIYNNLKFYAACMYFDIQDQIVKNLNKLDEIMKLTKSGKILIAADTNSRSKTWHDLITNTRGKKLEEYLAGTRLHIINEDSKRNTFNNRGASNTDLTIANNNLLTNVHSWEISEEENLSDHNYLKYKISMKRGKTYTNKHKYFIKEEKLHVFDSNLVQEMQKHANMTSKDRNVEEIDNYLSTVIATGNDIEQNIEIIEEAIQSTCRITFRQSYVTIVTARRIQFRGG